MARQCGAYTLAITDVEGSPITEAAGVCLPNFGGREPALPKTRSYLAAVMKVYYLAAAVGRSRGRDPEDFLGELRKVPEKAGAFLKKTEGPMKVLAAKSYKAIYFFGSGVNLGSVSEAALKLQETAQTISIPFELEEGMHGPWVTMNSGDLVTVLHFDGLYHNKSLELIRSLKHIGVELFVIGNTPSFDEEVKQFILIDEKEIMSPFYTVLPFYQMAYFMALKKGHNPDFMRFHEEPYLNSRLTLPR
jgi:glucosamine--fructose-6-phosphate aminotransferase (isomerizing)